MRFETICAQDINALAALWREAFSEDAEELIRILIEVGQGFCCCEDEKLAAMAFTLPYAVVADGVRLDGRYLYGVATAKEYRGQGIASVLLRHVEDTMRAQGADGLLLVPRDDRLRGFYKNRGFRDWSVKSTGERKAWSPCDAEEYLELRERYLTDTVHIDPPEGLMRRSRFYKCADGCRAELFGEIEEILPISAEGRTFAMAKALTESFPAHGFLSFAMDV